MELRSPDRGRPLRGALDIRPVEGVVALGVGLFATAFVLSPAAASSGPVVCPLKRFTGVSCPSCGLTRSWVHLAHGNFSESVAAHPFGLVLVVLLVLGVVGVVRWRVQRVEPPGVERMLRTRWAALLGVAWAAFAISRWFS